MSLENHTYKQIEDYLKGNMTSGEREAFEIQLTKDKVLNQEVQVQQFAMEALEMEYLKGISAAVHERMSHRDPVFKPWMYLGIAVVFLMIAGIAFINFSDKEAMQSKPAKPLTVDSKPGNAELSADPRNESQKIENLNQSAEKKTSVKDNQVGLLQNEGKMQPADSSVAISPKDFPANDDHAKKNKKDDPLPVVISKCAGKEPKVNVIITPADYDENSGEIKIQFNDIHPWMVHLEGVNSTFESKSYFSDLAAGEYEVSVKDADNCIYKIGKYSVPHSHCSFKKEYVFNILSDQEWKIPVGSEIPFKVSIFSKSGQEVFSGSYSVGENAVWNGLTKSGVKASLGLHKAIVTFEDKKTCIYNVVVAE